MNFYILAIVVLYHHVVHAKPRLYVGDDPVPYQTAMGICQQLNMRLIGPASNIQSIFGTMIVPDFVDIVLNQQLRSFEKEFWYQSAQQKGTFLPRFLPPPSDVCKKVVLVYLEGNVTLHPGTGLCSGRSKFICEDPLQIDAVIEGLSMVIDRPLTFQEAAKTCGSLNKQLAYIRSEKENIELTYRVQKILGRRKEIFWLGGIAMASTSGFRWYPSAKAMVYSNWKDQRYHSGRQLKKGSTCVALSYDKYQSSAKWLTLPCKTELPFICRSPYPSRDPVRVWIPNPEKVKGERQGWAIRGLSLAPASGESQGVSVKGYFYQ